MRKGYMLITIVAVTILTGCHRNSDYVVGQYQVRTTVTTSTCPAELSSIVDDMLLPTGISVGQTAMSSWKIERIGITGTGAHHINLILYPSDSSKSVSHLSGTLEQGFVRIDLQQDIHKPSYHLYRAILLRGSIEEEAFIGEIRILLSNTDESPSLPPHIPASSPCEVREEFSGTP